MQISYPKIAINKECKWLIESIKLTEYRTTQPTTLSRCKGNDIGREVLQTSETKKRIGNYLIKQRLSFLRRFFYVQQTATNLHRKNIRHS